MRATTLASPPVPLREIVLPVALASAFVIVVIAEFSQQRMTLAALACLLVAIAVAARHPHLFIPLAIIAMPLEILWTISALHINGVPIVDRFTNSTLLNVRLMILGLGAFWALTQKTGWEYRLPRGQLVFPAGLLLGVYLLATIVVRAQGFARRPQIEGALVPLSPASSEAILVIMALMLHLAFFLIVPAFIRNWSTLRLCTWTFVGVAFLLALAGIYQYRTGIYFWNPGLGLADVPRINTTFRDPNIYARLLVMGMIMAIAVSYTIRPLIWRLIVALGLLGPLGIALLASNSRGTWVVAALVLPLTALCMPMSRLARLVMLATAAGSAVAALILGELLFGTSFIVRLSTFGEGLGVLGGRIALIQGGWRIFLDHPLAGVGLAGFQDAFQGPYHYYHNLLEYRLSLSHTDAITILAELGILGAIVVAFLFYRFVATLVAAARAADSPERAILVGIGLAGLAIVLSSQTEGRLLSEPYLWLLFGLALAAEGIVRRQRGIDPREPGDPPLPNGGDERVKKAKAT